MKKSHLKRYIFGGVTAFLVVALSLVTYFLMFHTEIITEKVNLIQHILRPVSMGLVMAFLLLPVHKRIYRFLCSHVGGKKEKSPRVLSLLNGTSILLSLLFAFVILYILLAMVIPQVYLSIVGLVQSIPEFINTAQQWAMKLWDDNPEIQNLFFSEFDPAAVTLEQWLNTEVLPNLTSLTSAVEWVETDILPHISGVISNVSSLLIQILLLCKDLLIAVIVSVYLLASKDLFAAQTKKIVYSTLPRRYADLLVEETRNAYRITSGFINGKLLDSLIIGIITFLCCNLFHFPYPVLIAVIIGVTNIIPFFGPFIGAIPSALLIFLVDPMQCLYFCIFVFVLQQFDGNILGPKILGESTGLASFWVLFSILLFGGLFGFTGMVLGVPIFAIFYSIVSRLVNRGLRNKKLSTTTEDYVGVGEIPGTEPEIIEETSEEEDPHKES